MSLDSRLRKGITKQETMEMSLNQGNNLLFQGFDYSLIAKIEGESYSIMVDGSTT